MTKFSPADDEAWSPPQEYYNFRPDISGNELNGLGDTNLRPPNPILWHADPGKTPFGELQTWYRTVVGLAEGARLHRIANKKYAERPQPEVADEGHELSPAEWSKAIKAAALAECEADVVSIARINPNWVFNSYEMHHKWVIVMGYQQEEQARSLASKRTPKSNISINIVGETDPRYYWRTGLRIRAKWRNRMAGRKPAPSFSFPRR